VSTVRAGAELNALFDQPFYALPRFADGRALNTALQLLVWPAMAFTVRLKWAEWIVLKSFCPWCAISAITITTFAVLVVLDRRRVARLAD
jgi:uncharacterized membrane protein